MKFPGKGPLSESLFIEILKDAASSGLTGMIRLENGAIIKVVYFQKGSISFASSNEKNDRLSEVLKRAGKLTAEQVQDAQARLQPNVSLGKTLVELGYISPKDLLWGARAQVDGILHQLLFWNNGRYQVVEGTLPKEIIHLNLPVGSVIFDGILKTQNRDWILQHIGSPEAIYALSDDFAEQNEILKLPVAGITSQLNGKRTLHEIAQGSGIDSFELCKTVVALEYLGFASSIQDVHLQMAFDTVEKEKISEPILEQESTPQNATGNVQDLDPAVPVTSGLEFEQNLNHPPAFPEKDVAPASAMTLRSEEIEPPNSETDADSENEEMLEPSPNGVEESKYRAHAGSLFKNSKLTARSPMNRINWRLWSAILAAVAIISVVVLLGMRQINHLPQSVEEESPPRPQSANADLPKKTSTPLKPPGQAGPLRQSEAADSNEPLSMLQNGNLIEAAKSWNDQLITNQDGYSIQIVIACEKKTVYDTFRLLKDSEQLFILPMTFKGQSCYRVLYGQFPSRATAKTAIRKLPQNLFEDSSPATVVEISKLLS
jgi:hypothetical protein